jgi:hypothetical protein
MIEQAGGGVKGYLFSILYFFICFEALKHLLSCLLSSCEFSVAIFAGKVSISIQVFERRNRVIGRSKAPKQPELCDDARALTRGSNGGKTLFGAFIIS